jgi:hypothetical protein
MYLSTPLATRQATILNSVTLHSSLDVLLQSVMMMMVMVVVVVVMMMMMMKRSTQPWPPCSAEVTPVALLL